MATITEDYVSFEIAKLLKEKKFNTPLLTFYITDKEKKESDFQTMYFTDDTIDNNHSKLCFIAPTLQMAMKWLREVYKIDIVVYPYGDYSSENYQFDVYENRNLTVSKDDGYMTYEQACEAAIKYCLENLLE